MSSNGNHRDGLDRIVIPGYAPSEQPLSSAQRDEQRKALAALVRELAQTSDLHSHAIVALKEDMLALQERGAMLDDCVAHIDALEKVEASAIVAAACGATFWQRLRWLLTGRIPRA